MHLDLTALQLEPLGSATLGSSLDVWRKTFETNLFGMAATFHPFIEPMRAAGRGTLVGIASVAGRPLASSPIRSSVST